MLLTLHAESLADQLKPEKGEPDLRLLDLPKFTRETLDLGGLHMTTRLLKGATRNDLEKLRDAADKARCAVLVLTDPDALEFASESDSVGDAAIERTLRVMQAGQFLGCSSVTIAIDAPDDEDSFDFAIDRLKRVADAAERAEMNVLIAPKPGLTAEPERITELIKKIGGFRIGTLPDFLDAAAREDTELYLRRIAPYASAAIASTLEFTEPDFKPKPNADDEAEESDEETALAASTPAPSDEAAAGAAANGQSGDEKPADPTESGDDAEGDGADDITDEETAVLAELLQGVLGDAGDDEDEEDPPPVHEGFDLPPMIAALKAVGFDGTLAVRYRGSREGTLGVDQGRRALDHAIRHA